MLQQPGSVRSATSRQAAWWIISIPAFMIAAYALGHVILGERVYVDALADSFRTRPWGIYPHAFFGMFAIAIGPFQFLPALLRRRRSLHRALGKVYVIAGLLTGASGLYMAAYSHGGWITHMGFAGMALKRYTSPQQPLT